MENGANGPRYAATTVRWLTAAFMASAGQGVFGAGAAAQTAQKPAPQKPVPAHSVAPSPAVEQGQDGADILACELAASKRDVELLRHLAQEHERTEQLQRALTEVRRELELQSGLVAKTRDDAAMAKQSAEGGLDDLKRATEKERERAEGLARELAHARTETYAHQAHASNALDEAAKLRRQMASNAAPRPPVPEEKARTEELERDLADARRDVEALTALAVQANEETARRKEASERDLAAVRGSLQEEKSKTERLERDLAATRTKEIASAEEVKGAQTMAKDLAAVRDALQEEKSKAERLERELAATRSTEVASAEEAKGAKDMAAKEIAAVRGALQEEKSKAGRLERELAATRSKESTAAEATKGLKDMANEFAALRGSLQEEKAKAERLERELSTMRSHKAARQAKEAKEATIAAAAMPRTAPPSTPSTVAPAKEASARPTTVATTAATPSSGTPAVRAADPPRSPAAPRTERRPSPDDLAAAAGLLVRASALLGQGDIVSARTVLERAEDMGSVHASFALAETYDPSILAKWGTYGTRGDAEKARELYAKANAGGIGEAKARFEALRVATPPAAGQKKGSVR